MGTARNHRESYQESKEPGKPQEYGFSPKKCESSARNVLEHCPDVQKASVLNFCRLKKLLFEQINYLVTLVYM